jgi:hypothetical protein
MVLHDGTMLALPEYEAALEALLEPEHAAEVRLAKPLTTTGGRRWTERSSTAG